jgi:tripartite-type tricarboxylate transporter receptor subunit TctC
MLRSAGSHWAATKARLPSMQLGPDNALYCRHRLQHVDALLRGNAMDKLRRRTFLRLAAACAALSASPRLARSQSYPAQPVRLIVGFPAGGQVDIIARVTAQWLGDRLGQAVVVENKPGAGGNLGAQAVINAPPDGYTLFFAASSNTVNTTLFANLSYDFARDTTAIAAVNNIPLVLEANPSFQPKNIAELIAAAKASPGTMNMGSPSAGTPPYLCVDLLNMMTGTNIVHVPYFGENQMVTDLLGGQILVAIGGISSAIGHVKAGKLRALAVTTAARIEQLPDVATVGETVPGFVSSGWNGIVAPKNTPKEIVDKIAGAVSAIQTDQKFKDRLYELGVTVLTMAPADFTKFIASETEKWAKVVKFAGLKPQ